MKHENLQIKKGNKEKIHQYTVQSKPTTGVDTCRCKQMVRKEGGNSGNSGAFPEPQEFSLNGELKKPVSGVHVRNYSFNQ